jgi:hypothetical protein
MGVSAVSASLGGIVAAQAMFGAAAQAASSVGDPSPDAGDGAVEAVVGASIASQALAVNVAVLAKALDAERSLVNILA